jgi:ferredoxin
MGICESLAPDHFEVGDDGVMTVLRPEAGSLAALAGVGSCPAASLSLAGPASASGAVASLLWGVKASFVAYVRAVGGSVVADEGAYETEAGFVFPAAPSHGVDLEWRFTGRLTCLAHDGLLDVAVADPWVHLVDAGVELSVLDQRAERAARTTVASGPSDGPLAMPIPVALDAGAEHLFGSTYPAGTPLAPLVLSTLV